MYPSITREIFAQPPNWSFPWIALVPGCTICVDTLHHLCRVCAMSLLFKCTFYSLNIHFHHDDAFQRLIMFRNKFRVKGGIYTNNVPLPCKRNLCATTKLVIFVNCARSRGTICVDTLHYLCRVCAVSLLLKCIFYSHNIHFRHIEHFRGW